jgi:phage terminase large subunit-like protein
LDAYAGWIYPPPITAFVLMSEPDDDGIRYIKPFLFCPEDTIDKRSKKMVPYRYWRDAGSYLHLEIVDYDIIEDYIYKNYHDYGINRIRRDRWNSNSIINHLMMEGGFAVSVFHKRFLISHPQRCLKNGFEGKIN